METIVPAAGDWHLCIDDETSSSKFHRVTILAWAISQNPAALPVPITPFGRGDVSGEYMVQAVSESADQFIILPNGPALAGNDFNGAKQWFKQKRLAGAA
ncbi:MULTISPECIES: hypothetical protein [Rhodopseudomonas]|uniref:Uncharacterized protein n=1 Tax=Rhodopseudomonas palustris TaxID=1076 RepID=A0A0D7ED59_RHOPL|nr:MULTISPECIES: hypothetical protein [Rhodopseudomonas]KIZ38576.1 hypothetical protein OO17_22710 [Rhodopseudomonas palustris]MDF3810078.1 hypothetical protein [Rhodopseudomonas sp. BAL398]WOK18755.1 hypothetical protein RBJ75_04285 [Rhodopseudomonas sp. BAL398]